MVKRVDSRVGVPGCEFQLHRVTSCETSVLNHCNYKMDHAGKKAYAKNARVSGTE